MILLHLASVTFSPINDGPEGYGVTQHRCKVLTLSACHHVSHMHSNNETLRLQAFNNKVPGH